MMGFEYGRFGRRLARSLLNTLIWGFFCTSAAISWAADDPGVPGVTRNTVMHASASANPANGANARERTETDADRFFRTYMLPGTAVLVLMVGGTLTAVFYPKAETA